MRIVKKHSDALSGALRDDEFKVVKDTVGDAAVRAWCVFDHDGVELTSEGVSEVATAVCSNVQDLTTAIAEELNETSSAPSITFMKGSSEVQMDALHSVNLLVMREKSKGFGKGI